MTTKNNDGDDDDHNNDDDDASKDENKNKDDNGDEDKKEDDDDKLGDRLDLEINKMTDVFRIRQQMKDKYYVLLIRSDDSVTC